MKKIVSLIMIFITSFAVVSPITTNAEEIEATSSTAPAVRWAKKYGESSSIEEFLTVTTTNEGDIIVSGASYSSAGEEDYLMSINADTGATNWIKNTTSDYILSELTTAPDGSIIATGTFFNSDSEGCVASINPVDGSINWKTTTGGTDYDYLSSSVITSDGSIIAVGTTYSSTVEGSSQLAPTNNYGNSYVVSLNSTNGDLNWATIATDSEGNDLYGVTIDNSENILAVGSFENYSDGDESSAIAVSLSSIDGSVNWAQKYGDSSSMEEFNNVVITPEGSAIAVGYTGFYDSYIVSINSEDGSVNTTKAIPEAGVLTDVMMGADGSLIISGTTNDVYSPYLYMGSLNPTTLDVNWSWTDSTDNGIFNALTSDNNGNIVAAGNYGAFTGGLASDLVSVQGAGGVAIGDAYIVSFGENAPVSSIDVSTSIKDSSDEGSTAQAGEKLTYTINITNGSSVQDINVVDDIVDPSIDSSTVDFTNNSNLTVTDDSGNPYTIGTNNSTQTKLDITLNDVPANEKIVITFNANIVSNPQSGSTITNKVVVSGSTSATVNTSADIKVDTTNGEGTGETEGTENETTTNNNSEDQEIAVTGSTSFIGFISMMSIALILARKKLQ